MEVCPNSGSECKSMLIPVKDSLEVLNGKWKLQIITALMFGAKRFKEISNEVGGITDKMLSKELKDLEDNLLVKRTVFQSFPPRVEYEITEHGKTLRTVLDSLRIWGNQHREVIKAK